MNAQKRKRKKRRDGLVLQLLVIVFLVLAVFEGKLVVTMITHRSVMKGTNIVNDSAKAVTADGTLSEADKTGGAAAVVKNSAKNLSSVEASLAGFQGGTVKTGSETEASKLPTVSDPDSPAIVAEASSAVDDSYFSDAVFIGDSRMEGFRNASGITQGTFFTSVGMSLSSMTKDNIISTQDGNITVAAALSGGKYNKIYIMLGTNDLGEYDWNSFREGFISVTKRFQEIQPDAIFYICSVIYVEESKVTSGDYINNSNVDTINSILLEICEEKGYHYLDLNEFLSNGYGSLTEGATSDGVHIYPDYCKQMLEYLKTHYVADDGASDDSADEKETESEAETDPESV